METTGDMIVLGAQLEAINPRSDKTLKLSIGTQEATPELLSRLWEQFKSYIYIAIKPEPFTNEEIKLLDSLKSDSFISKTSSSQKLRGILYHLYEKNDEGFTKFENFYESHMKKIIDHYRSMLE